MQEKNWQKNAKRRLFFVEERAKMSLRDWLILLAVTLVYAAVAFTNLGSLDIPETYFAMENQDEEVTVEFEKPEDISYIKYFASLGQSTFSFSYSEDGTVYAPVLMEKETDEKDENGQAIKTIAPMSVEHDAIGIYEWQFKRPQPFTAKSVKIKVEKTGLRMLEMGFCGEDGLPVAIASISETYPGSANPAPYMFDEQNHVPKQTYYMTEMYFDEVYHARTAFEAINHVPPYEITHPPLGKTILSIGIQIFGMNPFGWRFMGTLVGVALLPLMYIFAKRLFKRPLFAFIPTFLLAVDFMHFSQTRIATIDSYSLFFVMLMYYFMYRYTEMNYNREPLYRTLLPLALCGVSFGLGAATKWLCIYAGLGLALLFFIQIAKRSREYSYVTLALSDPVQAETMEPSKRAYFEDISESFRKRTLITLLWCVAFFIIVPAVIYLMAYAPYMAQATDTFGYAVRGFFFVFAAALISVLFALKIKDMRAAQNAAPARPDEPAAKPANNKKVLMAVVACVLVIAAVCAFIWYESFVLYTDDRPYDFKAILGNQEYMFNYHSDLKTDKPHPFSSQWYLWPLNIRPVFFFQGEGYSDEYMSSMSTMGNPAVWWGALGAVIALVVIRLRKGKLGKRTFFLGVAAASEFVPWMLISRETFIYHYFETIAFLILLMGVLAKYLIERTKYGRRAVFIYMGVCLLLFVLFYPVTTGVVIPRSYADVIRWLPSWPFY